MNNLVYTRGTDEAIYKAGRKGLHEDNRAYMESLKDELVGAYANYHQLMDEGNLHQLTELWEVAYLAPADEREIVERKRRFLHDLYKSSRPIVKNHKNDILEQNNCDSIICPICGIDTYDEWDHYVPRELMPEYSVLTSNLIPLCHDCNHTKNCTKTLYYYIKISGYMYIKNNKYTPTSASPVCRPALPKKC